MRPKILLVEDETDLGNVVRQYLEIVGFDVRWAQNGNIALKFLADGSGNFQIALIDVSMPEMDGFELANRIVKSGLNMPFLFLTARNEKADRLYGLKIGADDYISKPFDVDELVLRIKNIIKRNTTHEAPLHLGPGSHLEPGGYPEPGTRLPITRGDVQFRKDSLKLLIQGRKEIILTPREAELLEYLFNNENRILKREEILTQLWGEYDYFVGRSLDVFISRLRKHLSASACISIN